MSDQKKITKVTDQNANPETSKFRAFCKWAFRLRSVPLAIPVIVFMIILAVRSTAILPDVMYVGTYELTKSVAVFGPVIATSFCLVMMFISKRVVYPWVISIFTLVLPVFLQVVAPFIA